MERKWTYYKLGVEGGRKVVALFHSYAADRLGVNYEGAKMLAYMAHRGCSQQRFNAALEVQRRIKKEEDEECT